MTSSIESVEYQQDEDYDMKPAVRVELDPRQLRAGIAALAIRPPPSPAKPQQRPQAHRAKIGA